MKPLRIKIQDEANLKKVPIHVIEKDYALSYVLAGIANQSTLSHSLIFKGGTALKKIFFGDYRFSEDLVTHYIPSYLKEINKMCKVSFYIKFKKILLK